MKKLRDFIAESFEEKNTKMNESEESVKDEKTFRDYAENKFREVFGDELDEEEMRTVIDGIVKETTDGDWGKAVGKLNKSFAN